MDRLGLAEAALAAAASRDRGVVVPDRVTSPMDCCATVPVARAVVDGCSDRARNEAPRAGEGPPGADLVPGGVPVDALLDPEMLRLARGETRPSTGARSA